MQLMFFLRGKELSGVLKISSCCLYLFLKMISWQQIIPQSVRNNLLGWLEGQQIGNYHQQCGRR